MASLSIEKVGVWWLPEAVERQWHGQLTESDDFFLLTATVGTEGEFQELASYSVIHGQAIDGTLYTLQECFDRRSTFGGSGLVEKTIVAQRVFVGVHIPPDEQSPFSSAHFSHPFLKAWLGISGFSAEAFLERKGFRIEYNKPQQRAFRLADGTNLTLNWAAWPAYPAPFDEKSELREVVELIVQPSSPRPVEYFDQSVSALRTLLALATRKVTSWPTLRLRTAFGGHLDASGQMVFPSTTLNRKSAYELIVKCPHPLLDMTFTANDLGEDLGSSLQRWFDGQELLLPILNLFSAATAARGFLEERFLALTQALETFHRRFRGGDFMDRVTYEDQVLPLLVAAIPATVVSEHREAMTSRLRYLNEYSLKRRIRDLMREHGEAMRLLFKVGPEVASEITEARNTLTHLPVGTGHTSLDRSRLYFLTSVARTLLELLLLEVLGFSRVGVFELVRTRQVYRRQALE